MCLQVDVGLVERGEQAELFVWQTWLKPTHRLALWFSQLPEVRPRGVGGWSVSPGDNASSDVGLLAVPLLTECRHLTGSQSYMSAEKAT